MCPGSPRIDPTFDPNQLLTAHSTMILKRVRRDRVLRISAKRSDLPSERAIIIYPH